MSKVYVVTTGSYSDYGIRGIFSTQELAEKYIADCAAATALQGEDEYLCVPSGFNGIAVMNLDEALKEKKYTLYSIGLMLDDGSVEGNCKKPYEQEIWGLPETKHYIAEKVPAHGGRGVVRAESHKSAAHVMKVAIEARQKWLREQP